MLCSNIFKEFQNITHGVFSPFEGVEGIKKHFKSDKITLLKQVHGITIFDANTNNFGNLPEADGSMTFEAGVVLVIKTADCSPILFYDEDNNKIAAVHAGWRGAVNGIIERCVDKLNSNNVTALVGPMIGVDSYEVKQDLIDKFEDKRFFHEKEGKFFFDFPSFINHKLEKSGVKKYENMGLDTFKNYKTLASYRYNTLNNIRSDERIYSAIMIKEKP